MVSVTAFLCQGPCEDARRSVRDADDVCMWLTRLGHSHLSSSCLIVRKPERLASPARLLSAQLLCVIAMPLRASCPNLSVLSWNGEMLITVPASLVRVKSK